MIRSICDLKQQQTNKMAASADDFMVLEMVQLSNDTGLNVAIWAALLETDSSNEGRNDSRKEESVNVSEIINFQHCLHIIMLPPVRIL